MKNVVSIKNNELLDSLTWNNQPLKDVIKYNILEDYENGIKFCNVKIIPSDLYWTNGNQAKSWQNGDILEIGEIVTILDENGDSILYYDEARENPYHFKVIDVRTRYEGQVLIELKLQECKWVGEI